jgi:hypothetical protein
MRWLDSLATRLPLRLALFMALASLVYWPFLRNAGAMNAFHDAHFLAGYERDAALAVGTYREIPLWDPYTCGGLYGLAAPQTRYASPFFLVSMLFGVDRAAPLIFWLCAIIGMEGTFAYARARGAAARFALIAAPLAGLAGFYPFALHFGWVQFASFQLVPWLHWGLFRAVRGQTRGAIGFAAVAAVAIGFGGTYTLPMAAIPLALELRMALCATCASAHAPPNRVRVS